MSRTVHEMRWRGNPDSTIAKTDENKYLAVIADTGTANGDATNIPVALTTTADLVPVGQLLTYTDEDRVFIESGMAILQASAAYAASQNGMGVLTDTTEGQVKAVAKNIAVAGQGTIIGGGTRTVGTTTVNVLYVACLMTG